MATSIRADYSCVTCRTMEMIPIVGYVDIDITDMYIEDRMILKGKCKNGHEVRVLVKAKQIYV